MMRRVQAMAFAPGATVFPGGRVDPGDSDPGVPWAGAGPDRFASRMGMDARTARSLVTAAVRELFEETGVLLALPLPVRGVEEARAAQLVGSEADEAGWVNVREALRAYSADDTWMLPPTVVMLRDLEAAGDVASVMAAVPNRSLAVGHPQVTQLPDGSIRLMAAGAEFTFPAPPAR